MEGNATRFEEALAAAESAIRGEQEAQRSEILGHINNAIAAVERVHQVVCVCVCV
jgi:glycerate kinase